MESTQFFVFCRYSETCRSKYNRKTSGWYFITDVKSLEEFKYSVHLFEIYNYWPNDDGTISDCNGTIVYYPDYPDQFTYTDYIYTAVTADDLSHYQKKAMEEIFAI